MGEAISLLCFTHLAANAPEDDFSGDLGGTLPMRQKVVFIVVVFVCSMPVAQEV